MKRRDSRWSLVGGFLTFSRHVRSEGEGIRAYRRCKQRPRDEYTPGHSPRLAPNITQIVLGCHSVSRKDSQTRERRPILPATIRASRSLALQSRCKHPNGGSCERRRTAWAPQAGSGHTTPIRRSVAKVTCDIRERVHPPTILDYLSTTSRPNGRMDKLRKNSDPKPISYEQHIRSRSWSVGIGTRVSHERHLEARNVPSTEGTAVPDHPLSQHRTLRQLIRAIRASSEGRYSSIEKPAREMAISARRRTIRRISPRRRILQVRRVSQAIFQQTESLKTIGVCLYASRKGYRLLETRYLNG